MWSIAPNPSRLLACIVFACWGGVAHAKSPPAVLSCQQPHSVEADALKLAPSGARRLEVHVLELSYQGGRRQFIDRPPYDEGGGLHWRYCGYDANAKVHLLEKADEGFFSGELVFEASGKVLPAGHTVLLSPNQQAFLAIEQIDGVDGESWTVYGIDGSIAWKGYAGITSKIDGTNMVVATFDRPRWDAHGTLTARIACAGSPSKASVALRASPGGQSSWVGGTTCAKGH